MAIQFLGVGAKGAGTGAVTYSIPSGTQNGDLLLMLIETANEPVTTPGEWLDVPSSPQGVGTAGGTAATRLKVMYRWVDGTSIVTTVSDPGNHQVGAILAFRGVDPVNPFQYNDGSTTATASTSFSWPNAIVSNASDAFIVFAEAHALPDSNTNGQTSTTADVELVNYNTNAGNGGGFSAWGVVPTNTLSYGLVNASNGASTQNALITLVLQAPPRSLTLNSAPDQTYTVTVTETGVLADRQLTGDTQAFTSTTFAATLIKGVVVAADQQSYAVGTTDTGIRADRRLTAETASVAATTTDTVLLATRRLTTDTRTYTATALDATLIWFDITELFVVADAQSYTVTANAVTVKADRKLTADAQNYTVTTVNAGRNLSLRADGAAVTVTAVDNVISTGLILRTDAQSYAVTANTANTTATRRLVADQASVSTTTVPAGVLAQRKLFADVRAAAVTPVNANVLFGRYVAANQATYALNRVDATLRATRYLAANDASYAVTGVDADLNSGNVLRATVTTYALTPRAANVLFGRRLTTQTTAFSAAQYVEPGYTDEGYIEAQTALLTVARRLSTAARSYALTPVAAALAKGYHFLPQPQVYVVNTVNAGRNLSIVMQPGSVAATFYDAVINAGARFSAQTALFSVQTFQSGLVFSSLPLAEDVAYRPLEIKSTIRPSESTTAVRPEDPYAALRPIEPRTGTYA